MVDKDSERRIAARNKRREELELHIDRTDSGYYWRRRVDSIGKNDPDSLHFKSLERRVRVTKTRHRLSRHFVIEEFDCKDGTKVRSREHNGLEYLCRQYLEPMRRHFGPCTVHSGFRTKAHNDAVGGEPNSYHRYDIHDGNDQAADVSFATGTAERWAQFAHSIRKRKRNGKGGIGIYSTFVHLDIRDYAANWRG